MATTIHTTITKDGDIAIDVLARLSSLSKAKLKTAMNKGAVQLTRKRKTQRLRRATAQLLSGDQLHLHYDESLLQREVTAPSLIDDLRRYSVWYKPAGVLAQGNEWGDHCALSRLVELHFNHQRNVFIVHRLDREARGIMLVAHDHEAAAALSQLFQSKRLEKTYQIKVRGALPECGVIDQPLDDKTAVTHFTRQHYDAEKNISAALVTIESGRKHQIRRHFDAIAHPVMGDPLYGSHHHDNAGLQLVAVKLGFICPLTKRSRQFELTPNEKLF